jgi:hypothetical protein
VASADLFRRFLERLAGSSRQGSMIRLVTRFVEDHHHFVANDLVHLAAEILHQRDDPVEVGVQLYSPSSGSERA